MCRYSDCMYKALGYQPINHNYFVKVDFDFERQRIEKIVKGEFKQIIDLLFDSNDGSLDSNLNKYLSSNTPEPVRLFVQNVLMQPLQSLPGAPDADTAMDLIIPRSVSSSSEFAQYSNYVKGLISDKYVTESSSQTDSTPAS